MLFRKVCNLLFIQLQHIAGNEVADVEQRAVQLEDIGNFNFKEINNRVGSKAKDKKQNVPLLQFPEQGRNYESNQNGINKPIEISVNEGVTKLFP